MKVTIDIADIDKGQKTIQTLQQILNTKSVRPCDDPHLIDVIHIMKMIVRLGKPEKCNACASLLNGKVVNHYHGLYPAYCILDAGHSGNHKSEKVQWSDDDIGTRTRKVVVPASSMSMEER